jgi:hypothetical protein
MFREDFDVTLREKDIFHLTDFIIAIILFDCHNSRDFEYPSNEDVEEWGAQPSTLSEKWSLVDIP